MNTILYSGTPNQIEPNFIYFTSCDLPHVTLVTLPNKRYIHINTDQLSPQQSSELTQKAQYCFQAEVISKSTLDKVLSQQQQPLFSFSNLSNHPQWTSFRHNDIDLYELDDELSHKRLKKDKFEIQAIQQACKITSNAMKHLMKHAKSGMTQKQVAKLFTDNIQKQGAHELAFPSIVAHNHDNQHLHHKPTDSVITEGSFVLLDLGCKYDNYCSDMSRCFPISGKFTPQQVQLYKALQKTFQYALSKIKPGAHWNHITLSTLDKLYQECVKLRLVKPNLNSTQKLTLMKQLMPHSLGHHIGLETHDCNADIIILEPRMVITLEPGLYFQDIQSPHIIRKQWNQYKSLGGIRLEDTLLITSQGYKKLTN